MTATHAAVEDPAPAVPQVRSNRDRMLVAAAWVLVATGLVVLYANIAPRLYVGDSDVATLVLQGQSVAHGNVTLSGWQMVYDSFWTVAVPFYAVAVALVGVRQELMYVVPAVIATVVVLLSVGLARRGLRGRAAIAAICVTGVLLALPAGTWAVLLLRGGWHVATIGFCLVAFVAAARNRMGWRWAGAVVLVALGLNGDLQMLAYGVAPILAAGVVAMVRTRTWRGGAATVAAGVAGVLAAVLLRLLVEAFGSYQVGSGNPRAALAQMKSNLVHLPKGLATAGGFGKSVFPWYSGLPTWMSTVRVVTLAAIVVAVIVSLARLAHGVWRGSARARQDAVTGTPGWRLDDLLVIAFVADLCFYVYAALARDPGYLRYLTPAVVFGAVLAGRVAGPMLARVRAQGWRAAFGAVLVAVAVLYAAGVGYDSVRARPDTSTRQLAAFLEQHDLHRGIATYWTAAMTTVVSGDRVELRPIIGADGRLVRYDKQSSAAWYRDSFQFLAFEDGTSWPGVNENAAVRTFGAATAVYHQFGYTVMVWANGVRVSPAEMSG